MAPSPRAGGEAPSSPPAQYSLPGVKLPDQIVLRHLCLLPSPRGNNSDLVRPFVTSSGSYWYQCVLFLSLEGMFTTFPTPAQIHAHGSMLSLQPFVQLRRLRLPWYGLYHIDVGSAPQLDYLQVCPSRVSRRAVYSPLPKLASYALRNIPGIPTLRALDFDDVELGHEGWAHLKPLQDRLVSLVFSTPSALGSQETNIAKRFAAGCTNLRRLTLLTPFAYGRSCCRNTEQSFTTQIAAEMAHIQHHLREKTQPTPSERLLVSAGNPPRYAMGIGDKCHETIPMACLVPNIASCHNWECSVDFAYQ